MRVKDIAMHYIYTMRILLLYFIFGMTVLKAQTMEDFSDGNITDNPTWVGDLEDFIINQDLILQLNASEAGNSFISTNFTKPDSFQFDIEIEMDFSPSNSNNLRIYFELDDSDLTSANGYFLKLGEDGSSDAIELYQIKNGFETLIGRGTESSISSAFRASIRVFKRNNNYTLSTNYNQSGVYSTELSWLGLDNEDHGSLMALSCTYTSTRADKFYIDNISIVEYKPDVTPPNILELTSTGRSELRCIMSEPIDVSTLDVVNFEVDFEIGNPLTVSLDPSNSSILNLSFDKDFNGGQIYQLVIKTIADLSGNISSNITGSFSYISSAEKGDLLLSEILFNPVGLGSDYVELFNMTDQYLRLERLLLGNSTRSEEKEIPEIIIEPNSYILLTEDADNVIEVYQPLNQNNIIEMDLPSFNNESGNVYLTKIGEDWEESFDYHEDMHNSLLDDVDGISLERFSYQNEVNEGSNWLSASASSNYGTPGYQNSNSITGSINNGFNLESSKFSPNNDGDSDFMKLVYKLENPGNILNLEVFDSNGFLIKELVKNQLLGTEGIITWDGTNNAGERQRLGIYILAGSSFDQEGNIVKIKQVISLVDFVK